MGGGKDIFLCGGVDCGKDLVGGFVLEGTVVCRRSGRCAVLCFAETTGLGTGGTLAVGTR